LTGVVIFSRSLRSPARSALPVLERKIAARLTRPWAAVPPVPVCNFRMNARLLPPCHYLDSNGEDFMSADVLLVDDEPILLSTLAVILEAHGFRVATSADVPRAVELIHQRRFSLLLTDLNMPGGGETVIRAIRSAQPEAPVVVITGHVVPDDVPLSVREQADAIFSKPVEVKELVAGIHRLLNG